MQVIDNVLDTSYLKHLQHLVFKDISWFCLYDSAFYDIQDNNTDNFSFYHILFDIQNKNSSDFFPIFLPAVLTILNKFNFKKFKLLRARLGLTTKNGSQGIIHNPHIDSVIPHKVIVFYINPSNGPTTLYQEKYTDNNITPTTFNILKQVDPVANRALMFDGTHYHSSSKPTTNNFRFVLNIDFQPP
jgi:hypothetical protein